MDASTPRIRLGSRESPLALAQANLVRKALQQAWPPLAIELVTFKTQGDRILDTALAKVGDKGLFVKELEVALLRQDIDVAIHSLKDMPGSLPDGLQLVSVLEREDPRDVLLTREAASLEVLAPGAVVGTSSLRREAQLRRRRPDLTYRVIRGNLQTRYQKLMSGEYDAIVLAAAGVHRLGWQDRVRQYFEPWSESVPAVAQGILGAEFRQGDAAMVRYLAPLRVPEVEIARQAERAVLETLAGGCQLPLAAYCRMRDSAGGPQGGQMRGLILSLDGARAVEATVDVPTDAPVQAGQALAQQLLALGGAEILAEIRAAQAP